MRKFKLFVFLFMATFTGLHAQIDLGLGGSYVGSGDGYVGLQGKGYIGVSEDIMLSPTFTFWLGSGPDWSLDTDVHYKLLTLGERFDLNPFAGLNFVKAGGETNVAINAGASFRFHLNSGASIYVEPKYVIIDNSGFVISAGYLF